MLKMLIIFYRSKHKVTMSEEPTKRNALVLGAGYVSAPLVEYLNRESNLQVTVGKNKTRKHLCPASGMTKLTLFIIVLCCR